jgi:bisphosphoglycerate-dependent phosphoglycerate mutase
LECRESLYWLDRLSEAEVPNLELKTGIPIVYDFNEEGNVVGKEILIAIAIKVRIDING